MPTRPIRITGSDSSTGRLTLDDDDHGHEHTRAEAGDTILWQIDAHSGVDSIIAIKEKSDSTNIFSTQPHRQGNNWRGGISRTAPVDTKYVYSITWLATDDSGSHTHDPIISIKPSTKNLLRTILIVFVTAVAAFLALFALKSLLNKENRR